jgi:hypothetical protein
MKNIHKINENIYITSDEEIKESDWYYWIVTNMRIKAIRDNLGRLPKFSDGSRKIILTTDQDLIKDSVKAIDDEFLEWFVKNPSCEYVPLIPPLFGHPHIIWIEGLNFIEEPKQETLEEAAEDYGNSIGNKDGTAQFDFIKGAKWQQEQILQFLYSEIIERRPYSSSKMCEVVIEFIEQLNTKK